MFQVISFLSSHKGKFVWGILLGATVLLTAYRHQQKGFSKEADSLKIGSFVEKDFPFISTPMDGRTLGVGFPTNNLAARTLAVKLGDEAFFSFDTDLLRWSIAWTKEFVPMALMAQVSYSDFFNKGNQLATIAGDPKLATGHYAGWKAGSSARLGEAIAERWGALPEAEGRWNGVYTLGPKIVLDYSVANAKVKEYPSHFKFDDQIAFTRSLKIDQMNENLWLVAAHIANGKKVEQKRNMIYIYQGASQDTVTAISFIGKKVKNASLQVQGDSLLAVQFSGAAAWDGSIAIWKGPIGLIGDFEKACKKTKIDFPAYAQGGPGYWKKTITTQGVLSPDTAAYVTDKLTLPLPNPWKRNVRVSDIAFFKDGRAAVITFEGDVWIVNGLDKGLSNIQWKRFASGLNETLSIEVVDETVLVFSRGGIAKLHDLNADGEADYYENFSNAMSQSAEGREWAGDLVHAKDGSYYLAMGGSLSNGPGVTEQVAKGFRKGAALNGTIIQLSSDGKRVGVIATGLRGPYLGYHPEKDILTASDQQGNFVPSTPLFVVKKGDYYGVSPTVHRDDNPPIAPPLTWIPHHIDQSAIGQAWITGGKMGPLNGDLIHFSYGRPGLFRVLIDSSSRVLQGGVVAINADYPAPTSKGAVSPADGQLYVAGFNLWGSKSKGLSALLRLRYTGKESYMPNHFRAGKEGVVLGFDSKLDAESALKAANFTVKRYNYKRTDAYGSGHFKLDGSTGEEPMAVRGAYLSADKKHVLLLIPNMVEVEQMELAYDIKAKDGHAMQDGFYFTINSVDPLNLKTFGFENVDLALLTKPMEQAEGVKQEQATVARGKKVFQTMACAGCHSEGTRTKGMYGPPFQGLYGTIRQFEDGSSTKVDDAYLRESILEPAKKIVKGYSPEMPSFEGILSDTDIASVSLYIQSLGEKQ